MVHNPGRSIWFVILMIAWASVLLPAAGLSQALKPVRNDAFVRGEKLKYRAYYDSYVTGKVTAGIATIEVSQEEKQVDGRAVYHIIGEGHSKGAFSWFFKVDDRFESWIDEEYLVPWMFKRRTHEGDYIYQDDVKFNQYSGSVSSTRANKKVPPGTQDIISAFYYTRTFDFSSVQPGDNFPVSFFLDDSVYVSQIQFSGREEVITDLGRFRCLRFKPMVATGNVFSQPYPMDLWVTDDKNHIPVLAKSAVVVGSVKLELIKYSGEANPVTALVKP